MKIEQQTIEEIQNQFKRIGVDYTNNKDITAIAVAHGEGAEAVITALKKQIPKPAQADHCLCGMALDNVWQYCPNCGQALKWGGAE